MSSEFQPNYGSAFELSQQELALRGQGDPVADSRRERTESTPHRLGLIWQVLVGAALLAAAGG